MPFISSPTLNFTTMVKKLDFDPTYELSSSATQVDEGQQVTFTLNTTNVPEGTLVPYSLGGDSGITVDDYEMVTSNEFVPATIENGNFDNNLDDFILIPHSNNSIPSSEQISWDSFGGLGTCKIRTGQKQVGIKSEIFHISEGQQTNTVRITIPHIDGNYTPSFYFAVEGTIYVHLGLPNEWDWIHRSPSFQSIQSFPNMVLNGDGSYSGYIDYQYTYDIKSSERYRLGFWMETNETQNIPANYSNMYIDSISYTTSNEQKGYFEIGSNDQASVTYLIKDDSVVEGTEQLNLSLDNGEDSVSVDIIDQTPFTYHLSSSASQVDEDGGIVAFNISSNVREEGKSIGFEITETAGVNNIESVYQEFFDEHFYDDFESDIVGWNAYGQSSAASVEHSTSYGGTMLFSSSSGSISYAYSLIPINYTNSGNQTTRIKINIPHITDSNSKIVVRVQRFIKGTDNGIGYILNPNFINLNGTETTYSSITANGDGTYSGYLEIDYTADIDLEQYDYKVSIHQWQISDSSTTSSVYVGDVNIYNVTQGNLEKSGTITPSAVDGSSRLVVTMKKDSVVYEGNTFDITFSETGSKFKLDTDSDFTSDEITKTINIMEQDTINYNVTASPLTISEGSSAVTVNISASNVLNFSSDRTLTVSSSDSTQVILSDTQVIIPAGQTVASLTFTPVDDSDIESDEVITLTITDLESSNFIVNDVLSDSAGTCSIEINLLDNEDPITYQLSSSTTQVNEGQQVTFTLNTIGVPEGTLVPYSLGGDSGITVDDYEIISNTTLQNSTFDTDLSGWTIYTESSATQSSINYDSFGGLGTAKFSMTYAYHANMLSEITHNSLGTQTNIIRVNIPQADVESKMNVQFTVDNVVHSEIGFWTNIEDFPNMVSNGDGTYSGYIEHEYTYDINSNETYRVRIFADQKQYPGTSTPSIVYVDSVEILPSKTLNPELNLDETVYSETDLVSVHNGSSTNGIYISSLEYLGNGIVLSGTYTSYNLNNTSSRIYRSTDNGENWSIARTFTNNNTVQVIKYLGDGVVLAGTTGSGAGGNVHRSTDYGQTWSGPVLSTYYVENLEYLGDGICILGAGFLYSYGKVHRSTDYGETWSLTDTSNPIWGNGPEASKRAATFKYLGNGICMGSRMTNDSQFRLIRSTDYGATWSDIGQTTLLSDNPSSFPVIEHLGDGIVAVAAAWNTSRVYISSDYGQTFDTTAKFEVSEWAMSMEHLGNGRVVLGTYSGNSSTETNSGKLYESIDYGQTWNSTEIFSPGVKRINKLRLNPENNTLLVGCKSNSDEPTVYILGDTNILDITGNFTVDAIGQASVTYLIKDDSAVEGTETLTLSLDNGEDDISVDLIDKTESYQLSSSTTQVNESQQVTFTLSTTGLAENTSVPYTIQNSSDITSQALTNPDFNTDINGWTNVEPPYASVTFDSKYGGSQRHSGRYNSLTSTRATITHPISGLQTNKVRVNISEVTYYHNLAYVAVRKNGNEWLTSIPQWVVIRNYPYMSDSGILNHNGNANFWSGYIEFEYTEDVDPNSLYEVYFAFASSSNSSSYAYCYVDSIEITSSAGFVGISDLNVYSQPITGATAFDFDGIYDTTSNWNYATNNLSAERTWGLVGSDGTDVTTPYREFGGSIALTGHESGYWSNLWQDVNYNFIDGQQYHIKLDIEKWKKIGQNSGHGEYYGSQPTTNLKYFLVHISPKGGWGNVLPDGIYSYLSDLAPDGSGSVDLSFTATSAIANGCRIRIGVGGQGYSRFRVWVDNVRLTDDNGNELLFSSETAIPALDLSGNFVVDENGQASVTYLIKDDSVVEGTEQLNLSLDNGEDSVSVDLIDKTPIPLSFVETDLRTVHASSSSDTYVSFIKPISTGSQNFLMAGCAAGNTNESRLYRSINNGNSWSLRATFAVRDISSIEEIIPAYLSQSNPRIFITSAGNSSSNGGDIFKSDDLGSTWTPWYNHASHEETNSMTFSGDELLFGSGYNTYDGRVYRSPDYGSTWYTSTGPFSSNSDGEGSSRVMEIRHLGGDNFIAVRFNSAMTSWNIIKSADGGVTWANTSSTILSEHNSGNPRLIYLGNGIVLAGINIWSDSTVKVYKSVDYGESFTHISTITGHRYCNGFGDLSNGRILLITGGDSNQGSIYQSTDYGDNWESTPIFNPGITSFNSISTIWDNKVAVGGKTNDNQPILYIGS